MPQVSKYPISEDLYNRIFELLMKVFLDSYSKQEVVDLLEDLFTPTERIMIAKRLAISILLAKKYTYREIGDILHVSRPTITDVSISMKYGNKGYNRFVKKVLSEEKSREFWEKIGKLILKNLATTKKSNVWRYLYDEVKNKTKKKTSI